ncbi:unnamed protein product [Strongylus vulgaris]|uniref:Uncharacterized protein n=1 Tax=Strongylus vulgaris TaxID=40348 RepID=A0A3P7J4C9_STRVU|nr:unnamed protein product [Strongylus vulgaris]
MSSLGLLKITTVWVEGPRYLEGKVSGAVFSDEKDMEEMRVYGEVFKNFAWSNPLWPKLFPGVRKMEAEVVRMCCTLMHGDEESCGTVYPCSDVNRWYDINSPGLIIPTSAHAAFTKAAEVFRIRVVRVPVDSQTFKVDVKKMKAAITSRTCMHLLVKYLQLCLQLVGSAPNFPFGTVDDIYNIPVHVDACLGGFLLAFIDNAQPFDFRVPGVCSISADTHKYGLAPKGSSVVLYRNKEYLHNQYFCDADWQGGIYASSTLEEKNFKILLSDPIRLFFGKSIWPEHCLVLGFTIVSRS